MNRQPTQPLHRVDLNLLVALDMLLKERNVTNAAQALFISQPAMSRNLKRLRDTFDDPLFIRTASGLTPTSKALQIGKELEYLLPKLGLLFNQQPFDSALCQETFSIALPAFLSSCILPELTLELLNQAPDANLVEMVAKSNPYDLLNKGKLDFALHYSHSLEPKHHSVKLGSIYPKLFVRNGHPLSRKKVGIEEIMDYTVVAMNVEEDHKEAFNMPLKQILATVNSQKSPKLRATQTQVLIDIALKSDAVIFGLNALSSMTGFDDNFVCIFDFIDQPEYHVDLYLLQHQRTLHSAPHQWLATKITDYVQKYT